MTNPYEAPRAELETASAGSPSIRAAIRSAFSILSVRLIALSVFLGLPDLWLETRLDALFEDSPWLFFVLAVGSSVILTPLQYGVFFAAARATSMGAESTVASLLREAVMAWPRVFAATFVSFLATLGTLVLLVIPGIYVGVRFSFADVIAFERRTTAIASCAKSGEFVTGRFWRAFALPLPLYTIIIVIEGIRGAATELPGGLGLIAPLAFGAMSSLILSVSAASYWFFYAQQVDRERLRPPSGRDLLESSRR